MRVQNDIFASLDAGRYAAILLLHLSTAFDTNDHSILRNRLKRWFGAPSTALNLLSSLSSILSGDLKLLLLRT